MFVTICVLVELLHTVFLGVAYTEMTVWAVAQVALMFLAHVGFRAQWRVHLWFTARVFFATGPLLLAPTGDDRGLTIAVIVGTVCAACHMLAAMLKYRRRHETKAPAPAAVVDAHVARAAMEEIRASQACRRRARQTYKTEGIGGALLRNVDHILA